MTRTKRYVDIDFETYLVQPGLQAPWPVLFSYTDGTTSSLHPWWLKSSRDFFMALLTDPDVILVNQFIVFDLAVACVGMALDGREQETIEAVFNAYDADRVRDTGIRQELLDIAAGRKQEFGQVWVERPEGRVRPDYSLVGLEKQYLGRDRSADKKDPTSWRMRYGELYGVPLEQWAPKARDYATEDAEGALAVFFKQGGDIPDECRQAGAAWVLYLASCWGMRTERTAVAALETEVTRQYEAIQRQMEAEGLYKIGGTKKAPKLTKDMKAIKARVEAAYAKLGVKPPMTKGGKKGVPSVATDADAMAQSGDELLEELGASGPVSTVLKTFLPVLKKGTEHPINTKYQVLVNTGRVSSREPNLNNVPRKGGVRETYVPRPGFYFSSVDYDCAELRSLAQITLNLFGRSKMAEFFQNEPKGDPHLALAATILGISLDEAKTRKKAQDPAIEAARQNAKAANFGFPGGMGVKKFIDTARKQYGITFTERQAKDLRETWLNTWPEIREYFKYISHKTERGEMTLTQYHPKGEPHRTRAGLGYSDGCNTLFQGLTADGAKEALRLISRECYVRGTTLFGSRVVGFLYDETILEVPIDIAHEAATRQAELMIKGMSVWVPDVPITCEPALMRRWLKNAKARYDANGRLVPWEPK